MDKTLVFFLKSFKQMSESRSFIVLLNPVLPFGEQTLNG